MNSFDGFYRREGLPHGLRTMTSVIVQCCYGLACRETAVTRYSLHHTHIFASDLDETVEFFRRWFDAEVVWDTQFAGARNVFVAVGSGRLHLYDQPPRHVGSGTVHHLGIHVENLPELVERMSAAGVEFRKPITTGRGARYVMCAAPDELLLELFEAVGPQPPELAGWFPTGSAQSKEGR